VRAPLSFVYGNLVFGSSMQDAWALFVCASHSYAGLSAQAKHEQLGRMAGALQAVGADVQLLRIGAGWDADRYLAQQREIATPHREALDVYLDDQAEAIAQVGGARPWCSIAVRLAEPQRDLAAVAEQLSERPPRQWWRALRDAAQWNQRGLLRVSELERLRVAADQAHARLDGLLDVRPARTPELQWLVRRAFCRGLGDPVVDKLHEPQALVFEKNGEAVLQPLEADVLRWCDGQIEHRGRALRIASELGETWQAQLVLGALPERATFPGPRAEAIFAPVEALPFAVDVSLSARYVPNELALRLVRRRIQDADQIARAESDGDQGISDQGYERTQSARDLLAYLQSTARPPLLRSTITVAVAARDPEELERRVSMCRQAWGEVRLHRPLGDQLRLFRSGLPGQPCRVAGYEDVLSVEQAAALMPFATHAVGSRRGFYLGHTLSGSRQPVRLDLEEGSRTNRPTTILTVGALGSGKTMLAQKLLYEGFLQGARIVDPDPKGDHRFHLLDEVAPHVETIPLRPDRSLCGLLDPLRVAPAHLRQEAAVSFLCDLLPARSDAAWITAIVKAVDTVARLDKVPTCGQVVRVLDNGDATDQQVAKTLAVYESSGLTQLGFAHADRPLPAMDTKQVTYIPIRDLPAAQPGTARGDYSQTERIAEQLVRLIALFAMHLMAAERERLKLFCFDEGWRLLQDPASRLLLQGLQRMGRSELAVPIISTQLVTDTMGDGDTLAPLLGATVVFGVRSEAEAARSLSLLGLDPDDERLRRQLLDFGAGRCLLRDHQGRVEAVQVDMASRRLLTQLSTTPGER
jgi:hypothetical protein